MNHGSGNAHLCGFPGFLKVRILEKGAEKGQTQKKGQSWREKRHFGTGRQPYAEASFFDVGVSMYQSAIKKSCAFEEKKL